MFKKIIFLALVLGIFFGVAIWGCRFSNKNVISYRITKAWWPAWDTFQLAVQKNEVKSQNFKTLFIQHQDMVSSLNEFINGKADAATLTIYEAILAASQNVPLKIVLQLDYTIGSDGVVAKKKISSVLDLKGKRIGIEQGTIAHFTLLRALEKGGLDRGEVKLISLSLNDLRKAFLDGKIDALGIYEPYLSELVDKGDGHVIFSSAEIPRAICDVLFVKEYVWRNNPNMIDHWIGAWHDALLFKKTKPMEYLSELSKLNGTLPNTLSNALNGIYLTNLPSNISAFGNPKRPGYLLESLENMQDFMLREKVIKTPLEIEKMIDFEAINRFFK